MSFNLHDLDIATDLYRDQQLEDYLDSSNEEDYPNEDDIEDARYHARVDD